MTLIDPQVVILFLLLICFVVIIALLFFLYILITYVSTNNVELIYYLIKRIQEYEQEPEPELEDASQKEENLKREVTGFRNQQS